MLNPGTKVGPYEVTAPLGAGGMGEVYRARDSRLGREVALKVLPEAFARDPERLARFEREGRLLATLNHPNVAVIYGVERDGDRLCLALELIAGESLAERLRRGALPPEEAYDIAAQVASALEAAHEAAVIHRDLKPGNVMVRPDGIAKVLDFGLARGPADGAGPADLAQSPTMTSPATAFGVVLGTAAYMSPEQARGRAVDRRSDIWAWGCLLYECLTGRRAFPGEDISETIACILKSEPDWSALPAGTPPDVRELLQRCLRKDTRERWRDAGDARLLLGEARIRVVAHAPLDAGRPTRRHSWLWPAALLAVGAGALGGMLLQGPDATPAAPLTVSMFLPSGMTLQNDAQSAVISPDGLTLAFAASDSAGNSQLWLMGLARADIRSLPGTARASQPFWSPDSRRIGFFSDGKLHTVNLETRAVEELCEAPSPRGAAWGKGVIVLQPRVAGPLMKIAESGGPLTRTSVVDTTAGDQGHRFPTFLPDGRHFVYSIVPERAGSLTLAVGSTEGGPGRVLGEAAGRSGAVYAAPGYLLFPRDGAVRATRLDSKSLALAGAARTVPGLALVGAAAGGAPILSASQNGIIVQENSGERPVHLVWMDREGRVTGRPAIPEGHHGDGWISPDGRRLAFESAAKDSDPTMLWLFDFERGTLVRLTFDGANISPVWSPDGQEIAFARLLEGGNMSLWAMRVDTPGSHRLVTNLPNAYNSPLSYSPDGRQIAFRTLSADTQADVMLAAPGAAPSIKPLLNSRFNEMYCSFSPDGRWMAYLSDETGRPELYVRPFPGLERPIRVSTNGANTTMNAAGIGRPVWRRDGRELCYVASDGRTIQSVDVRPGSPPEFTAPRPLFRLPLTATNIIVAPDLDRFLVEMTREDAARTGVTLIQNWPALLEDSPRP